MSSTPHVLIADDTLLVRWAVRRALTAAGFKVVEAENREQVLEALVSDRFQLVILSLALAGDDVEDIARAIASPAAKTSLVILTDGGDLPDPLRSNPRVRTLEKPFSVASLTDVAHALAPMPIDSTGESIQP